MRRLVAFTVLLGALVGALIVAPHWTARRAEAQRDANFRVTSCRAIPEGLVECPVPGSQRDAFLERAAATLKNSQEFFRGDFWLPVCRIAPLPPGRIIIVATTRAGLSDCAEGSVWRPANFICTLEERLAFLADAKARRTWARRENMEVIWMTSQSMAWRDYLVLEHRQWMILGVLLPAGVSLLLFVFRRTHRAFALRAVCHGEGDPELPRKSELLLHRRCLPGTCS